MKTRKLTMLATGLLLGGLMMAPVASASPKDSDGDGFPDNQNVSNADACILSDLSPEVIIDWCDPDVPNFLGTDGCTIMDGIEICAALAGSHADFVSCAKDVSKTFKKNKIIDNPQKQRIDNCAQQADIP